MRLSFTSRVTLLKIRVLAFAATCFVAQKLHTHFLETQVLVNKQLFSCVVIEWG